MFKNQRMQLSLHMMISGMVIMLSTTVSLSAQAGLGIAGGHDASDEFCFSYSVGQVFNESINQSEYYISQGIQHPSFLVISEVKDEFEDDLLINVYPNPTAAKLHLDLNASEYAESRVQLINIYGQVLLEKNLETNENVISLEGFEAGHYLLRVFRGTKKPRSFKVIKNK